ncbi:hypothetical protein ACOMHN_018430 [Nucella lapillus]
MSLESPDNEKNFPGLYKQGSLSEPATEEEGGGGAGKKRDTSRKRDGKRDKKEKGYTMFEEEESEEEVILPDDVKSPTKAKKTKPGFKFPVKKDIFPRMKEKEEKKDKESKKEEKEKKKEEKEGKKVKVKDKEKKKAKHGRMDLKPAPPPTNTCENPIFGMPLAMAVDRNKSHDGIQLPAIVRECIDYVEECGLTCEGVYHISGVKSKVQYLKDCYNKGVAVFWWNTNPTSYHIYVILLCLTCKGIYRISGVKSKVQYLKDCYNKGVAVDLVEHEPNIVSYMLFHYVLICAGLTCEGIYRISGVKSKVQYLKDCYNKGVAVDLVEHEPNIVASLLKQFLRELPEPVLTSALMAKFEEASTIKNEKKKVDTFIRLIDELPACNRLLLSWMIVHMTHIIELQKENKMSLQNVSIVLSPTMQISHRVLNALFTLAHQIFKETYLKKYVPPLKPATSRWSLELPDNTVALEEELAKQESLLNQLHGHLNAGRADPRTEDQLWEVQRVVTQLKRKIKFAKQAQGTAERRRKDLEVKRSSQLSETEELHLELRQAPSPPLPTTTATAVVEVHQKEPERAPHQGSKEHTPTAEDRRTNEDTERKPEQAPQEQQESEEAPPAEKGVTAPSVQKTSQNHTEEETSQDLQPPTEDKPETKEKRKSQEIREKRKSQDVGEKRKSLEPKEKRKSREVVSAEPQAEESSAVLEKGPEISVAKTGKDSPKDKIEQPPAEDVSEPSAGKVEEEDNQAVKAAAGGDKEAEEKVEKKEEAEGRAEGKGEGGGEKEERAEDVPPKDSLKGAGEVGEGEIKTTQPAGKEKSGDAVVKPVPVIMEEKEVKPRGPVQVHPHLYLSLEPLQPIKAQPLKPRRERAEKTEESHHRSAKLRELEEELLGGGSAKEQEQQEEEDLADGEKTEAGEEEEDDYEYDVADDEELQSLVEEEFSLRLEEEELLAIGGELQGIDMGESKT